jgi:hypothetical protein
MAHKAPNEEFDDETTARRRDDARLRALSTPIQGSLFWFLAYNVIVVLILLEI